MACSPLNGTSASHPIPQSLGIIMKEGEERTSGCLKQTIICWTWQRSCTCEHRGVMLVYTVSVNNQANQNPSMNGRGTHEILLLAEELLTPARRGRVSFLQDDISHNHLV